MTFLAFSSPVFCSKCSKIAPLCIDQECHYICGVGLSMRHCGGPNIIAKKIRVLFLRVAGFFHILKLNYLSIKMNYFADNFSWGKKSKHIYLTRNISSRVSALLTLLLFWGIGLIFIFFFPYRKSLLWNRLLRHN